MRDKRRFIPLFKVRAPGCSSEYTVYLRNDEYDPDRDCCIGPALMWSDESVVVWVYTDQVIWNNKDDRWHLLGMLQDCGWILVKML